MIPLLKPSVSQREIDNVTEVLKSGWWGLGPKTEEFEQRFAERIGSKFAVGVNSATAALHLACLAYEVGKGDEVIVPALTFASTALAPLYCGAKIVFADVDEETLCIDWTDVREKINPYTRAIIPVHYAGGYAGTPQIEDWAKSMYSQKGMIVIEDAAHACGNPSVAKDYPACWSFHAVKNLAMGDGGMITTNDENIYQKLLALRWCGIDKSTWERSQKKYGWDYFIDTVGYKAHMNDLTAAIGLTQLERLDELNLKRKYLVLKYLRELENIDWLRLPKWDDNSSWHLFVVRVDAKDRDRFIDHLLAHGISAGVHYKPLNTYLIFPQTKLPVTDRVWKTLVTLPLFPDITDEEFNHIIKTIKDFK